MALQFQPKIPFRRLGGTGLQVSMISFGTMTIKDQEKTTEMIKLAYDLGINTFDTAEVYGENMGKGECEVFVGNALKALDVPRKKLVVSVKVFFGGFEPNCFGLSRKHIIEGVHDSLKRLQLVHADIVFAHRDDPDVPMEEICKAFDHLVRTGKTFYWGTSMWSTERIMEAYSVCDRLGLERPVVEQPEYNLLVRDKFEKEYGNLFDKFHMGSTVWGPLAAGILTGKYQKEIPGESRYANTPPEFKWFYEKWLGDSNIEKTRKKIDGLQAIAKEVGATLPQFALAWVLKNKDVSTAIVGSTKPEQLKENVKALEFIEKITPEIEEKINKLLENRPEQDFNWKNFKPFEQRR